MTTVKEEWGMCCPECGRDDGLSIRADIWVTIHTMGTEQDDERGDHEWTDYSGCYCRRCGWEGLVEDTKASEDPLVQKLAP